MLSDNLWIPAILLLTSGLMACSDAAEQPTMTTPQENDTAQQEQATVQQHFRGTIVYKTIEGGFFALITTDNQRYTLRRLPAEFRLDGLEVEIKGSINHDMMTFTQFGELLDVKSVTVVDDSHAKPPFSSTQKLKSL
ncbi:MAG: hypothetical protein HWE26_12755 [Alteromonadaceae bacterium]|nr:hypothetical protein [Alteromonadaceae bacterium]